MPHLTDRGLTQVTPGERILLLSHCLRPSQTCPGRFTKEGLLCPPDCFEACAIKRFREAAQKLGYKGVCVAAGGAMAVRFVKEHSPQGIVAVACTKELQAGVAAVLQMTNDTSLPDPPAITVVPLLKDGCVDTEVDAEAVLNAINCCPHPQ